MDLNPTPVITEENVGAYLLTEQPDQAPLLKKNAPVARQDVVEARLMFQSSFSFRSAAAPLLAGGEGTAPGRRRGLTPVYQGDSR